MRFSHDLDTALCRRGFSITAFTSDQVDEHHRAHALRDVLGGIEIRRFPNPSNYLAGRMPWLWYYPRGLRRALLAEARQYDAVHIAEARGPHVRWAFAAARTAGIPVVWSPLGGLAGGVGIRKPYRRLYDRVHRTARLIRQARVLIAQSPHEAAVLQTLGASASQVEIVGLGVDARRFRVLPLRGGFRRRLGLNDAAPMVLFMGRFHPTKGLHILLHAAAIVRGTHPDLAVVLVGWDHGALPMLTRLTRKLDLESAVSIVPPMYGDAAVQAYVDADAFAVAATHYEETSLAALEALAAGTPCVLTRQCEVPGLEAMRGGVVTEANAESFAAGLMAVLASPSRRAGALVARQSILTSHTVEHISDSYAALFRRIAGSP